MIASVKYGASSSDAGISTPVPTSYASVIRLRNFALMMQPPRQIRATAPTLMSQPYSAAPAKISSRPCA